MNLSLSIMNLKSSFDDCLSAFNLPNVNWYHGVMVEKDMAGSTIYTGGDIRISNQIMITRALQFAQLRQAHYQSSVTITLGRRV